MNLSQHFKIVFFLTLYIFLCPFPHELEIMTIPWSGIDGQFCPLSYYWRWIAELDTCQAPSRPSSHSQAWAQESEGALFIPSLPPCGVTMAWLYPGHKARPHHTGLCTQFLLCSDNHPFLLPIRSPASWYCQLQGAARSQLPLWSLTHLL